MNHEEGQILIPGLALFLTLMGLFLSLVFFGHHVLMQQRVNMYAEATALSAARAQAEMMNKFASYNIELNLAVLPKVDDYAALQSVLKPPVQYDAEYQQWYQLPQFDIFPRNVGRRVTFLNHCDARPRFLSSSAQLFLQDMEVLLLKGIVPDGIWQFRNAYYVRQWSSEKRKAQPPHQTHWMISKDGIKAVASAQLYLDVQSDESLQNGGFPRDNPDNLLDNIEIQSFYPQFNARLLPQTPPGAKIYLEHI